MPAFEPGQQDLALIQNPTLGAYALWRFGLGFQTENEIPAEFALTFLVLPIVLHRESLDHVVSTFPSSGLALFAAKLGKQSEDLLAVHERARILRPLTLQSIGMGVSGRLLTIDYAQAKVRANETSHKPKRPPVPNRLKDIGSGAEKLGLWFSRLEARQIAVLLRVEF